MNTYPPSLIIPFLLTRAPGATVILVIIILIVSPMIWSRDSERQARSCEAFRMLIWLLQ